MSLSIFDAYGCSLRAIMDIAYILFMRVCFSLNIQVYAQPVGYWKNYYNLFDFAVLVVSVAHEILLGIELGGSGVTFLRMAAGEAIISKLCHQKNIFSDRKFIQELRE